VSPEWIQLGFLFLEVMLVLWAGTALTLSAPPRPLSLRTPAATGDDEPADEPEDQGLSWRMIAVQAAATLVVLTVVFALMKGLETLNGGLRDVLAVIATAAVIYLAAAWGRSVAARATLAAPLLAMVAAWLLWPGWLTLSLVSAIWIVAFIFVVQFSFPFISAAAIATVIALGYDYVQVFVTGGMLHAAGKAVHSQLPVMIQVPAHLALTSPPSFIIGLGDVAIPGILVVIAGRIGQRSGQRFFLAAIGGYAVGLAADFAVMTTANTALPALVFLSPGVVGAVLVTAWRRGAWNELRLKTPPAAVPARTGRHARSVNS
jgi:presenilin-like A22 family membrane protease